MALLFDLASMQTATTGTGTITLTDATYGFLTFDQAGVANGNSVDYMIMDGANTEVGIGTYTTATKTLTRSVIKSTNSNSAINLSGNAEVKLVPNAATITPVSITDASFNSLHIGGTNLLTSIGTVVPTLQVQGVNSNAASSSITRFANDTTQAFLYLNKSRGTSIGSHVIVQNGDVVGAITFGASDGTNFIQLGNIRAVIDGTPGTNSMPGKLELRTTPSGSTASTTRVTIFSDGGVIFGTGTTSPGSGNLNLSGGDLLNNGTSPTGTGAYTRAISPALTGTPTAPTASGGTNTTQIATTAFVAASFAPLASPSLTGTPTAPTASGGTNTTQIATTAFVLANGTTNASSLTSGTLSAARLGGMSEITSSLSSDVSIANGSYTDGPSISQGTSGTWLVFGFVTINDTSSPTSIMVKLWDGTSVIASTTTRCVQSGQAQATAHLSGIIINPQGNLRISCKAGGSTSTMRYNYTGESKDCTITAIRIG